MKIALKDFRAFQSTGLIDIRPLTFLVGENSSGKTSFLAALNYMWSLRDRLATPTFNSAPFDLGTFDEIVHRVRGRTKPTCFELIVEDVVTLDPNESPYFFRNSPKTKKTTESVRISLTFEENVGDAVISKTAIETKQYALVVEFGPQLRIVMKDRVGKELLDTDDGQKEFDLASDIDRRRDLSMRDLTFLVRRMIIERVVPKDFKYSDSDTGLAISITALEQLLNSFPSAVFASAPVRSNPSRVYTLNDQSRTPEGTHTPQRLFKIKESNQANWQRIKQGLEKFGHMSGMFSAINVAKYRTSGSSPFHINVTRGGKQSNIVDVGYGVSQALPILTDLIESPPKSGFLFQQPEVHLHPQAQAALGSFLVEYASTNKKPLIVSETHSDYLIDRVRLHVRSKDIRPEDVSLLYFQTQGTSTTVSQLEVDAQGNILKTPPGYRSFFVREQMQMLGIDA
ncbi:DUF3696 domain-containing protein [Erythrobacter sp. HA6-11]